MSVTEILGFVTGALCVVLVVRCSIWNWPAGLANNGFYLVLFAEAGLYADAGLQIVYLLRPEKVVATFLMTERFRSAWHRSWALE